MLQVAKRINERKVAFLGVLVGVGRGGLRKYRDSVKAIPQSLSHGEVPKDKCIQKKMKKILAQQVFSKVAGEG